MFTKYLVSITPIDSRLVVFAAGPAAGVPGAPPPDRTDDRPDVIDRYENDSHVKSIAGPLSDDRNGSATIQSVAIPNHVRAIHDEIAPLFDGVLGYLGDAVRAVVSGTGEPVR